MKRIDQLKKVDDANQLVAFLEKYGTPCRTKATGANRKTWCASYGSGLEACYRCKVDFWNEEVDD